MKRLLIALLTLSFIGSLRAGEKEAPKRPESTTPTSDSTKSKTRAHEGVWKPIAAVLGGMKLPEPALKAITLKITGENYEVTVEGEGPDKGTCTLDTSTTPHRMTIKGTDGPNKGKTF